MQIRDRIIEFRRVPACELQPNPKNWRTHPQAQQDALRGVLAEIGYAGAALAYQTPEGGLRLIDGHLRAETDPQGMIPTLILDVDDAEAGKLLATFDPLSALAGSDGAKLDALLREVDTGSEALQQMLEDLAEDAGILGTPEVIEDEAPEPPVDPVSRLGDLWVLGEHRLLCGDSTDGETVSKLMNGDKASMCFTSPPYGAGNVAKLRDHYVKGAAKRESFYESHDDAPAGWRELMDGWWDAVRPFADFIIVNVQMLADNKRDLLAWAAERRDELVDIVVWDKGHGAPQMQANVLSNAYEFVLMFGGNGSRAIPFASFHGTLQNVIRISPHGENENADKHRAVMPIALPLWAIAELCKTAESVIDPFSGTGTTLIAAAQLQRKCFYLEIDPRYCDVICQRYQKLTGKSAILEATGQTFDELPPAAQRLENVSAKSSPKAKERKKKKRGKAKVACGR